MPEMVKRRLVVVISPKISIRHGLCTVVALSRTDPEPKMSYHHRIKINLPDPWGNDDRWVKGDMVNAVGFHRLDLIRLGKDRTGKRVYYYETVSTEDLNSIRGAVLSGLGLAKLTKHL